MRIGTGFDLHRLEKGKKLVIGGIEIDHKKGAVAHSDGDVLIHALVDAMLGAFCKGDIGNLFPDTDDSYKNIDSRIILQKAYSLVPSTIVNIDSTIILQEPKLSPYIKAMRESLSLILNLDIDKISIKAKTAERVLGELGTGDAVIANVVILFD